jgi:hypothetical protein
MRRGFPGRRSGAGSANTVGTIAPAILWVSPPGSFRWFGRQGGSSAASPAGCGRLGVEVELLSCGLSGASAATFLLDGSPLPTEQIDSPVLRRASPLCQSHRLDRKDRASGLRMSAFWLNESTISIAFPAPLT